MRLARLTLWLIVLSCALPRMVGAQTQMSDIRFFELPTSLLNPVGAGARAAGQGFAFIGVADDATAASYNPGGLVQLEGQREVSAVGAYYLRAETQGSAAEIEEQLSNTLSLNFLSVVWPLRNDHTIISSIGKL